MYLKWNSGEEMNSVLCASSQSWVGSKMEKGINIIFSHKVKNLCLELFIHGFHGEAVRDTYRERARGVRARGDSLDRKHRKWTPFVICCDGDDVTSRECAWPLFYMSPKLATEHLSPRTESSRLKMESFALVSMEMLMFASVRGSETRWMAVAMKINV